MNRYLPSFVSTGKNLIWGLLALGLIVSGLAAVPAASVRAAACTAPSTDYGQASMSVNLPGAATYRVWTRIQVPDNTNNTYLLQVDNNCYTVGGGTYTTGSWVWISHQNGSLTSKLDLSLAQGARAVKLIGNKPNVKIDRVIFTSDLACVPKTTTGTDCNTTSPGDTTPPVVRITEPTSGSAVSGTVTVKVTANDTGGSIKRVELYNNTDAALIGRATAASNGTYSFPWDTTKVPNDTQKLIAKAYDASENQASDEIRVTVQNGDRTPPSIPGGLSGSAPAYNKITLTWNASTDNIAVKGYTVIRDSVPLADVGNATSFTDTGVHANTSYSYKVYAYDTAGNKSAASGAVTVTTPNVDDAEAPTMPTGVTATARSATQVDIAWAAAADNIGVTAYDVYRAAGSGDAQKIATITTRSFGDTNLRPATSYTYYVVAKDGAGNESDPSDVARVTTTASRKKSIITGTIRSSQTKKGLSRAAAIVTYDGHKHIYQANRAGEYTVRSLDDGRYNVTYRGRDHYSRSYSVKVGESAVVTKHVVLQKR